ncbi:hypothetical protein D9M68_313610 [compost metagenome]
MSAEREVPVRRRRCYLVDIDSRGGQLPGGIIRTLDFTPYDPHRSGIRRTVPENLFSAIQPRGLTA